MDLVRVISMPESTVKSTGLTAGNTDAIDAQKAALQKLIGEKFYTIDKQPYTSGNHNGSIYQLARNGEVSLKIGEHDYNIHIPEINLEVIATDVQNNCCPKGFPSICQTCGFSTATV